MSNNSPTVPINLDAIYAFAGAVLCITMFCSCIWIKVLVYRRLGVEGLEQRKLLDRDIAVKPKLWELRLSSLSDMAKWKNLMVKGVRTIVAIHAIFANPRMHATSLFCLRGIRKFLTINSGSRPNTQSATALSEHDTNVTITTVLFSKHQPSSRLAGGSCFCTHHALIGRHWKIASRR